jgi:hypothetical protein
VLLVLAASTGSWRAAGAQGDVDIRLKFLEDRLFKNETTTNVLLEQVKNLTATAAKHEQRIQTLEQRVEALSKQIANNDKKDDDKKDDGKKDPQPLRVRAPFEVVDNNDRAIMRVVNGKDGPSLTLLANASKTEIRAGQIDVRGGAGGDRGGIQLGVGTSGNGFYVAFDKSGGAVASLGFLQGENRLALRLFANSKVMAELGENDLDLGSGALKLGNGRGAFTAELSTNPQNDMALRIRSNSNQVVAGLGVDPDGDGGGALKLANKSGNILASAVAKASAGHVTVFGTDGKARANIGAEPDGRGFVRVGTADNLEAASLTVVPETGGGVLQTKDKAGIGVSVGTKRGQGGLVLGDLCATSSKQKSTCFSTLAAKNLIFYF